MKENFYHGLLLGLLRGSNPGWLIKSNRESGDGFSDILIKPEDPDAGIVIEVKYAKEMISLMQRVRLLWRRLRRRGMMRLCAMRAGAIF